MKSSQTLEPHQRLQAMKESILSLVKNCVRKTNFSYNMVVKAAITALTDSIPDDPPEHLPKRTPRGRFSNIRGDSSDDEYAESEDQLEKLEMSKRIAKNNCYHLFTRIKATQDSYREIEKKIKNEGIFCTENSTEAGILKLHLLTASIVVRVPHTKNEIADHDDLANRVLDAVNWLPRGPNEDEKESLKKLKKEVDKAFVHNKKTYADGKYCGTPDAVVIDRATGNVTSVAEFKKRGEFNEGKWQLLTYLHIFQLDYGHLVLQEIDDKLVVEPVYKNDDHESKLLKKLELFKNFKGTLAK